MAPDELQHPQDKPTQSAFNPYKPGKGEDPQVPGKPRAGPPRPPGEVGGHTVQRWEQDPATAGGKPGPSSRDTPPPQAGAPEAAAAAPGSTRPPRPTAHAPQKGHGPAPRPPPAQAQGLPETEGDALVEAITKAVAENLAKALHQSIAQAVREALPLSRSVDPGSRQADAAGGGGGGRRPSFTGASTAAGTAGGAIPGGLPSVLSEPGGTPQAGARRDDAGTGQGYVLPEAHRDSAAPESPGPSGAHPTGKEPQFQAGSKAAVDPTRARAPQVAGGRVQADPGEGPEGTPGDPSPPPNRAAAAADEATREGRLA